MKPTLPWHSTPIGVFSRALGSIELAVPTMIVIAAAMVWGTYLESTIDAKAARGAVYGSWWFIAIMALVCLSLFFAALTRLPWKRRHVGFLTVHASLITLIVAGFISLFGRLEGNLGLGVGQTGAAIELDDERLELLQQSAGEFIVVASMPAPRAIGDYQLADLHFRVTDYWKNVTTQSEVADGGPEPYRAVQLALGPDPASSLWIGDEARGGPARVADLTIRVLAAGLDWKPPTTPTSPTTTTNSPIALNSAPASPDGGGGYDFLVDGERLTLGAEGDQALPGWTITSIQRFSRPVVTPDGLAESDAKEENPAVLVTITDGKGTTERHTAFANFPDIQIGKTLEGAARSAARLVPSSAASQSQPPPGSGGIGAAPVSETPTLVFFGEPQNLRVGYLDKNGESTILNHPGPFPWTFSVGNRSFTLHRQVTHAQEVTTFAQAPDAPSHRPAIVLAVAAANAKPTPLPWKATLPVTSEDGRHHFTLRYGPRTVDLPFSLRLDRFNKVDYPGTSQAMAFESHVTLTKPGAENTKVVISMNQPLALSGWKVYQSSYMGDSFSIFSVMRDPGLTLTYFSCATLCLGILITFYGRGLNWGHPGIPTPFDSRKENNHAS